jgi:CheY-like chemotaxis protein
MEEGHCGQGMGSGRKKGVLIAEDEAEIRTLLTGVFEFEGFEVYAAHDGEAALKMFASHADAIVLIVVDLGMPKMGGLDVIEKVRQLKPSVKIIAASGYGRENVHEIVLKAGGDAFLSKPFVIAELIETTRKILSGP